MIAYAADGGNANCIVLTSCDRFVISRDLPQENAALESNDRVEQFIAEGEFQVNENGAV